MILFTSCQVFMIMSVSLLPYKQGSPYIACMHMSPYLIFSVTILWIIFWKKS